MKKTKAIISPVIFGVVLLSGNVLIACSAPHLEMSPLRVCVTLFFYRRLRWFRLSVYSAVYLYQRGLSGILVYWYGLINHVYPWNKFLIHNVVYLKTSNAKDGYYIVFSTKKRPMEKAHGIFMWPFSIFEIPYTAELYSRINMFCPTLTKNPVTTQSSKSQVNKQTQ